MARYLVASGTVIHWSGGAIAGGSPVPAALLAEWGETGLKANIDAGSVLSADATAKGKGK